MNPVHSLRVEVGPLGLEHPFLLASAPPTATGRMIRTAFNYGWAGAVTKTITPDNVDIRDVSPRYHVLRDSRNRVMAFENIELLSPHPLAYWVDEIRKTKDEYPDKVVIASMAADTRDAWPRLAERLQEAGSDALELNFSCPHGMPERGMGAAIGQHEELIRETTAWVKEVARVPVIVKLTPNVTDIAAMARAARDGGADSIAAINTVQSLMGIDLDRLEPLPSVRGASTFGGMSGRAAKPIGLRAVAQIAAAVDLPIHGMGGVETWEDAAEYIAVGAHAIQVCTAVMLRGYSVLYPLLKGLDAYLARKGFDSVQAFRGAALPKLGTHQALDRQARMVAYEAQPEKCILCQRCALACADGGFNAIQVETHSLVIDADRCDGCSLCTFVCPTQVLALRARETAA